MKKISKTGHQGGVGGRMVDRRTQQGYDRLLRDLLRLDRARRFIAMVERTYGQGREANRLLLRTLLVDHVMSGTPSKKMEVVH